MGSTTEGFLRSLGGRQKIPNELAKSDKRISQERAKIDAVISKEEYKTQVLRRTADSIERLGELGNRKSPQREPKLPTLTGIGLIGPGGL